LLAQPDAPPGAASPTHATLLRTGASGASYRAQVAAALERTRSLLVVGDRLLAQHDADPGLGADPGWVSEPAGTVEALAVAYRGALDLQPGAGDAGLQACLTESLRLIWTGHALLHRAFGVDGHHAYHDSSHGNWDLDLGVNRLQSCQNLVRERR